jgi:hypothetical protein
LSTSRPGAMAPPPLTNRTPAVLTATTRDFPWPDFDRWQAAFAAAGCFPPQWEGLERAPLAHTPEAKAYRERKFVLFCEWLDMLAQRPVVRAHYARRGIRARVERQDQRPSCPACDPFDGCEVGPELEAMPPFHPGCRCVLVAFHPRPSAAAHDRKERHRSRMRRA